MQDPVVDLHLGLKGLAGEDRDGWSSLAQSERVRELVGVREATEIETVRMLASWDRRAAWADDGAVTAVSWLKHQLDLPQGEAAALVRLARHYDQHPAVATALDGGGLSMAKAKVLLRAERGHEEMFAACLDGFVEMAADLSITEFTEVLVSWADLLDEDEPPDPERRSWRSGATGDLGRGLFNSSAENLAIVQAAIEALDTLDPVDGPEKPRSREQRHHDIVVDIFRRVLADELGDDPAAVSNLDVTVDADVAVELFSAPSDREELFDGDPLPSCLRPYRDGDAERILRRCHRADGTRAKRVIAEAMLCFSFVRRILVDPVTGQPLDVGRAHRRFTPRQNRALAIRDGGCMFPGCDRGVRWTEAHHLHFWRDGGPTDLDNALLLCRRHHTLIHRKGWSIRRDPTTGVVTATRPDGTTFTRRPTRRC
jgi:hypothetical protein